MKNKWLINFNKTCINENILPKYTKFLKIKKLNSFFNIKYINTLKHYWVKGKLAQLPFHERGELVQLSFWPQHYF